MDDIAGSGGGAQGALVVTDRPIPVSVTELVEEGTPAGMVCLGTTLSGRLVARCVVPPEVATFFVQHALFRSPVRLALAAQEEPPGLQCRLFAIVALPDMAVEEEDTPPWAESVPSSNFDRLTEPEKAGGATDRAAVLLGHIVRFARDRRHPDNLPLEAADVLASIVSGDVNEVVDKVIDDLLG